MPSSWSSGVSLPSALGRSLNWYSDQESLYRRTYSERRRFLRGAKSHLDSPDAGTENHHGDSSHRPAAKRHIVVRLPAIILHSPGGKELDTDTTYQQTIRESKLRSFLGLSMSSSEWRLPHVSVPARPDYSRVSGNSSMKKKNRKVVTANSLTEENLRRLQDFLYYRSNEDKRSSGNGSFERAFSVSTSVVRLPLVDHNIKRSYVPFVESAPLHNKSCEPADIRTSDHEFPGWCYGCRMENGDGIHWHGHPSYDPFRDRPVRVGGGFAYATRDAMQDAGATGAAPKISLRQQEKVRDAISVPNHQPPNQKSLHVSGSDTRLSFPLIPGSGFNYENDSSKGSIMAGSSSITSYNTKDDQSSVSNESLRRVDRRKKKKEPLHIKSYAQEQQQDSHAWTTVSVIREQTELSLLSERRQEKVDYPVNTSVPSETMGLPADQVNIKYASKENPSELYTMRVRVSAPEVEEPVPLVALPEAKPSAVGPPPIPLTFLPKRRGRVIQLAPKETLREQKFDNIDKPQTDQPASKVLPLPGVVSPSEETTSKDLVQDIPQPEMSTQASAVQDSQEPDVVPEVMPADASPGPVLSNEQEGNITEHEHTNSITELQVETQIAAEAMSNKSLDIRDSTLFHALKITSLHDPQMLDTATATTASEEMELVSQSDIKAGDDTAHDHALVIESKAEEVIILKLSKRGTNEKRQKKTNPARKIRNTSNSLPPDKQMDLTNSADAPDITIEETADKALLDSKEPSSGLSKLPGLGSPIDSFSLDRQLSVATQELISEEIGPDPVAATPNSSLDMTSTKNATPVATSGNEVAKPNKKWTRRVLVSPIPGEKPNFMHMLTLNVEHEPEVEIETPPRTPTPELDFEIERQSPVHTPSPEPVVVGGPLPRIRYALTPSPLPPQSCPPTASPEPMEKSPEPLVIRHRARKLLDGFLTSKPSESISKKPEAVQPLTKKELKSIVDPLDYLSKYCLIRPDRLPFYERVFRAVIGYQQPRFRTTVENMSDSKPEPLEAVFPAPPPEQPTSALSMATKQHLLRSVAKLMAVPEFDAPAINIGEFHMQRLTFTIKMLYEKYEKLIQAAELLEVQRERKMANIAKEVFPEMFATMAVPEPDTTKKQSKEKKPVPAEKQMPDATMQKPSKLSDREVLERLQSPETSLLTEDAEVRSMAIRLNRLEERIAGAEQRMAELEVERQEMEAWAHELYNSDLLSQGMSVEARREHGHLTSKLHPDEDFEMNLEELEHALQLVNNHLVTNKELLYIYHILKIPGRQRINLNMFSCIAALSEKVQELDPIIRNLINSFNFDGLEIKMEACKELFNILADREANAVDGTISLRTLAAELIAGGLTSDNLNYVVSRLDFRKKGYVEYLDFLTYIPLFIEIHEQIVKNPLADHRDTFDTHSFQH